MVRLVIFALCFICITYSGRSQKPEYGVLFEGIGDNREFASRAAFSQTILGSRIAFQLGVIADGHRLRAGISHLSEFGSYMGFHKPEIILYYQYEDDLKTFHFGSFPRRELVNFPLAMFTDTLLYYRPNIEGLRGELRWQGGWQNAFVDWTGRQTAEVREAFTAATSGEISFGSFFLQNYVLLNHLAHSLPRGPGESVNDNLGYSLLAGWRLTENQSLSGYFSAGLLGSVYRERSAAEGFISGNSLLAVAYIQYKATALKNTLHTGDGHIFLSGDPFYHLNNYMRTDFIWHFIKHKNVTGRFNVSLHWVDWNKLDNSQQISILYRLPTD